LSMADLPFDPADDIASVSVVMLRVHQLGAETARTTLEITRGFDGTIWDHATGELGHSDLAAAGYVATKAKLVIRFLPGPGERRGRSLPVLITVPRGCNLKDRTDRERLIGSKYLRQWGIMIEI
jgi:hypothetical protein